MTRDFKSPIYASVLSRTFFPVISKITCDHTWLLIKNFSDKIKSQYYHSTIGLQGLKFSFRLPSKYSARFSIPPCCFFYDSTQRGIWVTDRIHFHALSWFTERISDLNQSSLTFKTFKLAKCYLAKAWLKIISEICQI